jgi:hypothetical protein
MIQTKTKIIKCNKCDKIFKSYRLLDNHKKRKTPCGIVHNCTICNTVFIHKSKLDRHLTRKTSCSPIKGSLTIRATENTCIWCRKKFSSKYSATSHMKNGKCKPKQDPSIIGHELIRLMEEQQRLQNKIKNFEKLIPNTVNINQIVNNSISNNIHNTFNINFINFSESSDIIKKILDKNVMSIISCKNMNDIPLVDQLSNKINTLVGLVYRNPSYKELQGIYVIDPDKTNNNAFYYEDGTWKTADWDTVGAQVIRNLYNSMPIKKEIKYQDKINVIKNMFVLGKCGKYKTLEPLSDINVKYIYNKMGNVLNIDTIDNTLL